MKLRSELDGIGRCGVGVERVGAGGWGWWWGCVVDRLCRTGVSGGTEASTGRREHELRGPHQRLDEPLTRQAACSARPPGYDEIMLMMSVLNRR